jgi:hypothetical protein
MVFAWHIFIQKLHRFRPIISGNFKFFINNITRDLHPTKIKKSNVKDFTTRDNYNKNLPLLPQETRVTFLQH